MNDLIEKLKQNKMPFGLNTKEEQVCFENVECKNCIVWGGDRWCQSLNSGSDFSADLTYRISPDYQPSSSGRAGEVEKCEVGVGMMNRQLHYLKNNGRQHLTEALNDPDFMYFEYEHISRAAAPRISNNTEESASWPKYVVFRI